MQSPNDSQDLESSHVYMHDPPGLQEEEEIKNVDDPIIREMLDEWAIGNSFQEDNRAVTVHGKRPKKQNQREIAIEQPSFQESPIMMQRGKSKPSDNMQARFYQ